MNKPKSIVVKSKSSNSAITMKSEPRKRKKSRSNAEIQRLILKKRGVYVEKKATKMSINERDLSPVGQSLPTPRPPSSPRPIPRPGRKRFLASVLKILSQSTTGTQYPDRDNSEKLRKQDRIKSRLKKKIDDEIIPEDNSTSTYTKRKPRYRSKILNEAHHGSDFEQLIVLQSTKEITHTPSNVSERSSFREPDTIKWADIMLSSPKKSLDIPVLEETKEKENQETPITPTEAKIKPVDKDPSTLIAEVPNKDDKKFYNFFYDLLETTFSVYNVKTEFNNIPTPSAFSSKVHFEMDESVAKKLTIPKTKDPTPEEKEKEPLPKYYCIKPDIKDNWDDKQLLEHFQPKPIKRVRTLSPTKSVKRRHKIKPEPIEYKKRPIPATTSLQVPTKKTMKKERKKIFMNLLKEQLKMEDDAFEEPRNFYEALKIIARNKRRYKRSIHFADSKKPSEGDVHECQFKRRRLISASTKSSKKSYNPESDFFKSMKSFSHNSNGSANFKKRNTIRVADSEMENASEHSLEVFGFDYEPVTKPTPAFKQFPSFPPSTATSQEYGFNQTLLMKYSDSGTSSILESSHLRAQHGLRSLSELLND
ncbi:uncharacterized protein LOC118280852 [Spodoptera frugiperda]|uniref:Uncharacterized protein LOC118280852 n=1 Tax=Spodoptera frugiperda TaxID=7108 RepID=A0A9R0EST9_SPOFR|nr:uncharacterized protein LOC118280852 [Spodoptera frugiperda]